MADLNVRVVALDKTEEGFARIKRSISSLNSGLIAADRTLNRINRVAGAPARISRSYERSAEAIKDNATAIGRLAEVARTRTITFTHAAEDAEKAAESIGDQYVNFGNRGVAAAKRAISQTRALTGSLAGVGEQAGESAKEITVVEEATRDAAKEVEFLGELFKEATRAAGEFGVEAIATLKGVLLGSRALTALGGFGGAAGLAGIAGLGVAGVGFTIAQNRRAESLQNQAALTRLSLSQVQQGRFSLGRAGLSPDALGAINSNLQNASVGSLRRIGAAPGDTLAEVIEALARIEDPAERVRAAFEILGEEGRQLALELDEGNVAQRQWVQQTDRSIESFARLDNAVNAAGAFLGNLFGSAANVGRNVAGAFANQISGDPFGSRAAVQRDINQAVEDAVPLFSQWEDELHGVFEVTEEEIDAAQKKKDAIAQLTSNYETARTSLADFDTVVAGIFGAGGTIPTATANLITQARAVSRAALGAASLARSQRINTPLAQGLFGFGDSFEGSRVQQAFFPSELDQAFEFLRELNKPAREQTRTVNVIYNAAGSIICEQDLADTTVRTINDAIQRSDLALQRECQ